MFRQTEWLSVVLALVACGPASVPALCEKGACGPRGLCLEVGGEASCICQLGFRPEGWTCVAEGSGSTTCGSEAESLAATPVRPALVALSGGTFLMGSPESELGRRADEGPVHEVTLSPFLVCATEVTEAQYEAVTGTDPSDCEVGCQPDFPVHGVTWFEAVAYLNALSEREGLEPCYAVVGEAVAWDDAACSGYRLPSEAEWEYAARAGTTTAYSFGDDLSRAGDYAWYSGNADGRVHAVATKEPNPWGLFDLQGNLWEWVWDWYAEDAYSTEPVSDPRGPDRGEDRTQRGGSFVAPSLLRSAVREPAGPRQSYPDWGFRCVRSCLVAE